MAIRPDDWWGIADLDEFHVHNRPPTEVVAYCERHGYDYVEGSLLDHVTADGRLAGPVVAPVPRGPGCVVVIRVDPDGVHRERREFRRHGTADGPGQRRPDLPGTKVGRSLPSATSRRSRC